MSIESIVEKFIREEFMHGGGPEKIDPQESLIESGVIDSLTLLRLITFLEEQFNLRVEDDEVLPEYFESLETIKAFVEGKQ